MSTFRPAWWLPGPHLQTLWASLNIRGANLSLTRERIDLSDGDFIDLDWGNQSSQPIVIILHGLEGSANSNYARGLLQKLNQCQLRGVVLHFRGCSGEANRALRAYHSGDTEDLASVIAMLQQREPQVPIAAVGFSLGGNVLLKWLGETGAANPLCCAVAVSVPFELRKSALRLQTGFSRLYQRHLLKLLCKKIDAKKTLHDKIKNFPNLDSLHTIYDFDDRITAPLHNFASADDYYARSSSRQFLKTITVPTLLLQAKDDPFLTPDALPQLSELSKTVSLELSSCGGHVGFVAGGWPFRPRYWLEERIPLFLEKFL
jgi:predicted alpha/beta-fold hydrolase